MTNDLGNTNRIVYLDCLRIFATAGVILLHVSAQNYYNVPIDSAEYLTFHFYDSLVQWVVPVFTMISGALFLNGSQTIKTIYTKNIRRLLTAFLFWSVLYAGISFFENKSLKGFISEVITGHYHMWYLIMMMGLYMLIPFLRLIVKNDVLTKYFLLLGLVFSFLLPQIMEIVTFSHESTGRFMSRFLSTIQMHFVIGYTFYYVLGFYLDRMREVRHKTVFFLLGMVGFSFTFVATICASYYKGTQVVMFYDYFSVNVLMQSVFVFFLFKNYVKGFSRKKSNRYIGLLGKWSFGAYLIHALILDGLDKFFQINTLSFNPLISVPILWMIVLFLSYFLSALINKIPYLNSSIV